MSISLTEPFPVKPQQGLYARAVNFAKQYVKATTLDWIENHLIATSASVAAFAYKIITEGFNTYTFEMPTPKALIVYGIGVAGILASMVAYHKYIKHPFINQEVQTIVKNSKKNALSMLIFHTSDDWNGSFANHQKVANYQKFADNYSIEILEGSSTSELRKAMKTNQKKYDRIDFQAHANEHSIQLASGTWLRENSVGAFKWLNDHLKENGIIGLECCRAGKGEDNIAREISRACPNATVYAAADSINAIFGAEYEEDGTPCFNDGSSCRKGKDITRIYQNGVLIR